MALKETYEKQGNFLFRWRSFLPLLIGPLLILVFFDSQYTKRLFGEHFDSFWGAFCVAVSFAGFFVRCLVAGYVPSGTSGRNTKSQIAESLNTRGMYSMVRNPLYLGNYLIVLGLLLFTQVWWFVLVGTAIFWIYYERIIFAEEAFLRDKFGDTFMKWAENTPVIIPDFSKWESPELTFSVKNVLKREFNGFFAIIATITALHVIENVVTEKSFQTKYYISETWEAFFLTGLAIYLILWFLKKFTRLLKVEGR